MKKIVPEIIGLKEEEAIKILKEKSIEYDIAYRPSLKKRDTVIKTKQLVDDKLKVYVSDGSMLFLLIFLVCFFVMLLTVWALAIKMSKDNEDKINQKNITEQKEFELYGVVKEITPTTIKVGVSSTDTLIYYYSLDDVNYFEGTTEYTFTNLNPNTKYIIYIKAFDIKGSYKVIKLEAATIAESKNEVDDSSKKEDEIPNNDTEEEQLPQEENNNPTTDDNHDDPTPVNPDPSNPTTPDEPTPVDPVIPEIEYDIPKISLDGVPLVITYGDSYSLPTWYDFGNDTGTISCAVDNNEVTNTNIIGVGEKKISCIATSSHNKSAIVEKTIKVEMTKGEDEILDGWIRYNIYYPEDSYDWKWRLDGKDGIRTGYDSDDWQDYTGPVLVKVEDVENIYISYKIDGEVYIITPKGKALVDIRPQKWTLYSSEKTMVNIVYGADSNIKEYRINGGEWQTYNGEFEVEANTLIDARVVKNVDVLDSLGNVVNTKTLTNYDSAYISEWVMADPSNPTSHIPATPTPATPGSLPSVGTIIRSSAPRRGSAVSSTSQAYPEDIIIAGPTISSDPSSGKVDQTTITINSQDEGTIYYSIDNSKYSKYTNSFTVNKNCWIKAYYVRNSDGVVSQTSRYRVSNIKVGDLPYINISATPSDYLSEDVDKVNITISGSNYDSNTLEYSLDGTIYQPYISSFDVEESLTVYARAKNKFGTRTESLTITTKNQPKSVKNLDVLISASPSKNEINGLVNKTEITIFFDEEAEEKYYSLDGINYVTYNGPFTLTSNDTIYAYAKSSEGNGSDRLQVDYLTTGISSPVIDANTTSPLYSVNVVITYDKNAISKKYRIDGGDWINYTEPFEVNGNCQIEAFNSDLLGNKATSSIIINNIIPTPTYTLIDNGMYYIIKPNYPDTVDEESREYKWKVDGVWKKYNQNGIVLIKEEYASLVTNVVDGIKITDANGNEVIFTDHYYVLDGPLYSVMEDLFIRFNTGKPQAPSIMLNTKEPTSNVNVSINYSNKLIDKQYKIVYEDGTTTGWLEYNGSFNIDRNNAVIFAKGYNRSEIESDIAKLVITNIDEINPDITISGDLTTPKQKVTLFVKATDNLGIDYIKYMKDSHSINDFNGNGNIVVNNSAITINENGIYTFYVRDRAGREIVKEIEVTNIDLNAPDININVLTNTFGITAQVEIDYGDSVTKKYSIGNNTNYQDYNDVITINSQDVYQLANEDKTLTIYAKGIDSANNVNEVSEAIYVLDLDMPQAPEINAFMGYPVLTSDGWIQPGNFYVIFDPTRDDLVNEISFDNGSTWQVYTGYEQITGDKILARSVAKSGLTIQSEKEVTLLSDVIGGNAVDDDSTSTADIAAKATKSFEVREETYNKLLRIYEDGTISYTVSFYPEDSTTAISTTTCSDSICQIRIPVNTKKVSIKAGTTAIKISGIDLRPPQFDIEGESILQILEDHDELKNGYYSFMINNEIYPVHLYVLNGDQTITENTQFGDDSDVGRSGVYAQNMVIVKVNGDLTINDDVTIAPYYTTYGGPKGFTLYVTGKLTNNGIIDNSHGGYAKGQDVYLWKNQDATNNEYEVIPALGGTAGRGANGGSRAASGGSGAAGTGRQTGGGGGGLAGSNANSGAGGRGTSYSGGTGGGSKSATAGSSEGGAGGKGSNGGGVGNPGGTPTKTNGTGGLLIIFANGYENNGTITAKGTSSVGSWGSGGASGGGSINIFTNQDTGINGLGVVASNRYAEILGDINKDGGSGQRGEDGARSGNGGAGTVNIGEIRNGTYYDLVDAIQMDIDNYAANTVKSGESILDILNNNSDIKSGYYNFIANGETYPVHLYVLDGNQTWSENKVFGDENDISQDIPATSTSVASRSYAQNMVVVKVNGDLTINEGVTVGPYYTTYGGPKGFTLYVTGKLTNNGIIDNSHGAYAPGQNVYLWKNQDATNGEYEVVPELGANAGGGANGGARAVSGGSGAAGTGRQTGGGGGGLAGSNANSGAGGRGTSYSGGTGGGSKSATAGSSEGGAGGNGSNGGGVGNPGGTPSNTNGTGGLLIIFANGYENNGTITAKGTSSVGSWGPGGASGGGSINIFTNQSTGINGLGVVVSNRYAEILGNFNKDGGVGSTGEDNAKAGSGGSGTVNIGEIRNGTYYDLKDIIQQDIDNFTNNLNSTNNTNSLHSSGRNLLTVPRNIVKPEIKSPTISIDSLEPSQSKVITISNEDNYTIEYSIDLGESWISYTEEFETTSKYVIARYIDNDGNIISSSSYTITSYIDETTDNNTTDSNEEDNLDNNNQSNTNDKLENDDESDDSTDDDQKPSNDKNDNLDDTTNNDQSLSDKDNNDTEQEDNTQTNNQTPLVDNNAIKPDNDDDSSQTNNDEGKE